MKRNFAHSLIALLVLASVAGAVSMERGVLARPHVRRATNCDDGSLCKGSWTLSNGVYTPSCVVTTCLFACAFENGTGGQRSFKSCTCDGANPNQHACRMWWDPDTMTPFCYKNICTPPATCTSWSFDGTVICCICGAVT